MGRSPHTRGREQIFFLGFSAQAPKLKGGCQVWKPVRDHQLQGVLMRCSWHLGEVCSSFFLAGRFSSCGVGRVITNAAFMTHLWVISLNTHTEAGILCFSGLQVGRDLQHKCVYESERKFIIWPWRLSSTFRESTGSIVPYLQQQEMHLRRRLHNNDISQLQPTRTKNKRISEKRWSAEQNQTAGVSAWKCFNLSWKLKSFISKTQMKYFIKSQV